MAWLDVINSMDDMAARGTLTAPILRGGLQELLLVPIPRPGIIEEKIRDWTFALDNKMLPDGPAVTSGGGYVPPISVASLTSSPMLWIGGVLALYFLFGKKKGG